MPNAPKSYRAAQVAANAKAYDKQRGSFRERGYSTAWTKASEAWRLLHPWCEYCKERGIRNKLAECVDHIKPVKWFPHLMFDPDNLKSSCNSCNARKAIEDAKLYGHLPVPPPVVYV
jgi:5-methylcytosine-specific restriction protein A